MVNVNPLDLWKHIEWLSVDDFMCLLFGRKPGTIKFDYGDPKDWPENADIVYKLLSADIWAEKLNVLFEDPHRDPRHYEYFSETYDQPGNPWWTEAQLSKHQLVKWLVEKKLPSDFFGVAVTEEKSKKSDEVNTTNAVPQPYAETVATGTPTKTKKKYKPRGVISAETAAAFLGISSRQVQNWDKGIHRPPDYPGREDETLFQMFVTRWNQKKLLTEQARAMNRPVSYSEVVDRAAKDAFDDDDDY